MTTTIRWTIRRLMIGIAILAIAIGLGRPSTYSVVGCDGILLRYPGFDIAFYRIRWPMMDHGFYCAIRSGNRPL